MKKMRYYLSMVSWLITSLLCAQEIDIQSFATGLVNPVNIKNAGDSRLFVVERAGFIQIVNSDGTVNNLPFLDIEAIVNNNGGERGLLGLAFHPDYATNGFFYVNYINLDGNTVISRFSRNTGNSDLADNTSEVQLLSYVQPYPNHNGGDMAFGPDGYLYISSGDGGDAGDPGDRSQSLTTLLGKILRIDVDGTSNGNYGIPADNPYAGSTTAMEEIWAYGLRNPWKFSFDRLTDELWIADVGQDELEEINLVSATEAGVNYGWRCYEGNSTYDLSGNCPPSSAMTFPVAQYSHLNDGAFKCSITGGYRYRGTAQPGLVGLYFFADFCSNEIGYLEENGSGWDLNFTSAYNGNGWSTFGEDTSGELYIAGIVSGTIYKIIGTTLSLNEHDAFAVKMFPNPSNHEVTLDILDSAVVIQSVKIFNMQGKLISLMVDFRTQPLTISTKDLTSGMYFVEVTDDQGRSIIKTLNKI